MPTQEVKMRRLIKEQKKQAETLATLQKKRVETDLNKIIIPKELLVMDVKL